MAEQPTNKDLGQQITRMAADLHEVLVILRGENGDNGLQTRFRLVEDKVDLHHKGFLATAGLVVMGFIGGLIALIWKGGQS